MTVKNGTLSERHKEKVKIMLIKCTCASSTLSWDENKRKTFQKCFSSTKIYSIFFSLHHPPRNVFPRFHFVAKNRKRKKKNEIFSHFAAGSCATNVFVFFFANFFTWCDGRWNILVGYHSNRLDFNCYMVRRAGKETNLELSR